LCHHPHVIAFHLMPSPGEPLPGEPPSAPEPEAGAPPATTRAREARGCIVEILQTLILTALIFFGIQAFVAQPYLVEQLSMERTLEPGHYVLVDKLTPRFDGYHRGDIVVFRPPETWAGQTETPFIKRVIGEPGDRVEINLDGLVVVNGTVLDETYLYRSDPAGPTDPTESTLDTAWTVPQGELFLMGDHRAESVDSRVFGPVPINDVIGRAWLRYWPLDQFGILATPDGAAAPPG
jgi:signal peptidase I